MGTVEVLTATAIKMALAAALAVGAGLGARRLQQARIGWRPATRSLRVVETAVLGQQRAVHLVSVGGRTLLIASTQSQVALLADVTGEHPAPLTPAATQPSFAALISQLLPHREETQAQTGAAIELRAAAQKLREGAA